MKKYILILALLTIRLNIYGQITDSQKLEILQTKIDKLEEDKKKYFGQQADAINASIGALEQEKSNLLISIKSRQQNKAQQKEDLENAVRNERNQYNNIQTNNYNQEVLNQLKQNQIQSQNNYNQEISNTLNSLSRGMQAAMYNNIKKELDRRSKVSNNFVSYHGERINKLTNLYGQVPKSNFSKNLNGLFAAHLFQSKKYSFVNNNELVTESNCIVNVEQNIIKNIYLYGKESFELDYPKTNPENSQISNGIVKYSNYDTLETITLLILEPYLSKAPKSYSLLKDGVSYLTVWTDNKKEENKIVYIQELDTNDNIVREISTPLIYAKDEKLIEDSKRILIPMNSENKLLFFGEVTQTPYGRYPLYPRMSKSDMKPLIAGEKRLVEIKKYRE